MSRSLVRGSTRDALSQKGKLECWSQRRHRFTHQPVVVLNPLALEGRCFRGLGAPDDVIGISDKDAHAEATPLRDLVSGNRRVNGLICCCSCCVGTGLNGSRQRSCADAGNLWPRDTLGLKQSSIYETVVQTLFVICSCRDSGPSK